MGLDQNLYKRTYVKNWDHLKEPRHTITKAQFGKDVGVQPDRIAYIVEEVGYWRKANAIHKWFVDHCQEGVDDCRDAYVSREQLEELLGVVNTVLEASEVVEGKIVNGHTYGDNGEKTPILEDGRVIKDSKVAEELLPTGSGLFFGSTDYDQYYIDDLKHTKEMLEEELKTPEGADYSYSSSW